MVFGILEVFVAHRMVKLASSRAAIEAHIKTDTPQAEPHV